jgi:hypothetical protein
MSSITQAQLAAVARAFDMDARDVRADTPLTALGWTGSASDWLLVADHLGIDLRQDPVTDPALTPVTIDDLVTILISAAGSERADRT